MMGHDWMGSPSALSYTKTLNLGAIAEMKNKEKN